MNDLCHMLIWKEELAHDPDLFLEMSKEPTMYSYGCPPHLPVYDTLMTLSQPIWRSNMCFCTVKSFRKLESYQSGHYITITTNGVFTSYAYIKKITLPAFSTIDVSNLLKKINRKTSCVTSTWMIQDIFESSYHLL